MLKTIKKSIFFFICCCIINLTIVGEKAAFGMNLEILLISNQRLTLSPLLTQSAKTMQYLVTLYLEPPQNSLEAVKQLSGIEGLDIDEEYGLVPISPKRHLYVIRVKGDLDPNHLMSIQPAVKGVHGDIIVSPYDP